eukprot:753874-Hanusia_phi.AAC.6
MRPLVFVGPFSLRRIALAGSQWAQSSERPIAQSALPYTATLPTTLPPKGAGYLVSEIHYNSCKDAWIA